MNTNDPRLTDFVLGELSESDYAEVQKAVSESPELQAAIEEIRAVTGSLEKLYAGEEPISLTNEQRDTLGQRPSVELASKKRAAETLPKSPHQSSTKRPNRRFGWWVVAGLIGIAVSLGALVQHQSNLDSKRVADLEEKARQAQSKIAADNYHDALVDAEEASLQVQPLANDSVELHNRRTSEALESKILRANTGELGPAEVTANNQFDFDAVTGGVTVDAAQDEYEQLLELAGERADNLILSEERRAKSRFQRELPSSEGQQENGQRRDGQNVDGQVAEVMEFDGRMNGGKGFSTNPSSPENTNSRSESTDSIKTAPGDSSRTIGGEIQELVGSYNTLLGDQRYEEAEAIAEQVRSLAPGSEVAAILTEKSKLALRVAEMEQVKSNRESGFFSATRNAELDVYGFDGPISSSLESRLNELDQEVGRIRESLSTDLSESERDSVLRHRVQTFFLDEIKEARSELANNPTQAYGRMAANLDILDRSKAGEASGESALASIQLLPKSAQRDLRKNIQSGLEVAGRRAVEFRIAVAKAQLNQATAEELRDTLSKAEKEVETSAQLFGEKHPETVVLGQDIARLKTQLASAESQDREHRAALLWPLLARRIDASGTKLIEIDQMDAKEIGLAVQGKVDELEHTRNLLQTQLDGETDSHGSDDNPNGVVPRERELRTALKDTELAIRLVKPMMELTELPISSDSWNENEDLVELKKHIENYNKKVEKKRRTWRRSQATANATRLMVGAKDELDLSGMQVNVQVDGFRARVLIDCFFYNDRPGQLEGRFKLRLPDDASLYYFAFGQSRYDFTPNQPLAQGEFREEGLELVSLLPSDIRRDRAQAWDGVKEARMVPKEKAAFAYSQTVRRRIDPALVEWTGAGVFSARVFPLMPKKMHRIVIGYDVDLTHTEHGLEYAFDVPAEHGQCQVDINVAKVDGGDWSVEPKPSSSRESKLHTRYRFDQPKQKTIRLTSTDKTTFLLRSPDSEVQPFFATRLQADVPQERASSDTHAVFMVDTSLSSRPDKFNVWIEMLRATLDENRDSLKQFAVLFFDVNNRYWRDGYVENTPENVEQLIRDCYQLGLEGATDLHSAVRRISETEWVTTNEAHPDLFLLSDGSANWGETNMRLIEREIESANVGSLFAYQTGHTGTAIANLRFLASQTGGAVFSVAGEDEVKRAATAHRNRPWRLESVEIDGASDIMTAGRVEWVYPGQVLTIVGRGSATGNIVMNLSQSGTQHQLRISPDDQYESEMASRLYGQVAVGQLESLGDDVFDVSSAYARHFRVTGKTCSLLMLESEAEYQRFDIKPKEDLFVVRSKDARTLVDSTLAKHAESLADPKTQLVSWLNRLETMPGMNFTMPTALKIALDDMKVNAIDGRLHCTEFTRDRWSKAFAEALTSENIDYDIVAKEASLRDSADDSIRVYSSLIERSPGDWALARDVAFTAIELKRPAAAYHLLRSVAKARPFEGSIYSAIGGCLAELGQADMAMIYFEIALGAKFQNRGSDFRRIVGVQYRHVLERVVRGELESSVKGFSEARLESLQKESGVKTADLLITMSWNTDATDVDLHVVEPSGEECSYQNKNTKLGGAITQDITTGFGPEMYLIPNTKGGAFDVLVKYYSGNQNQTSAPAKVYLTIYKGYGTNRVQVSREAVRIKQVGHKEKVKTVQVLE